MDNIEYIQQKITLYKKIDNVECAAKLYFESLGYQVYFSKNPILWKIEKEYTKNDELLRILKEDKDGIPDLLCIKDNNVIFVEVKSKDDSIKQHQLSWIQLHPIFKVIIFGLEYDYRLETNEEIFKLEKINEKLKEKLELSQEENREIKRNIDCLNEEFYKKITEIINYHKYF